MMGNPPENGDQTVSLMIETNLREEADEAEPQTDSGVMLESEQIAQTC
jgi:hypothetical protein